MIRTFDLKTILSVAFCTTLLLAGQGVAYVTASTFLLLTGIRLDLLSMIQFYENLPYYGLIIQIMGAVLLCILLIRNRGGIDKPKVKIQFKKLLVIVGIFGLLSVAFLATVPTVKATLINTSNYFLDTPLPIADYYVGQYSNSSYFAINGSNWGNYFVSTNASAVINSAIGNLTTGGKIHLSSGSFSLTNELLFEYGIITYGSAPPCWVLEGSGKTNTMLSAATEGMNVIHVRNQTTVYFRDFGIDLTGLTSANGIMTTSDGSYSEVGLGMESRWSNIITYGSNTDNSSWCYTIVNTMNCYFDNVRASSTGASGWKIWQDSDTINYGNSIFTGCIAYSDGDGYGVLLNATGNGQLNFLEFHRMEIIGTGYTGLYIGTNVMRNTFFDMDIEGADISVHIASAYGASAHSNRFYGGYLDSSPAGGSGKGIVVDAPPNNNYFEGIQIYCEGVAIDDSTNYLPTHYKDIWILGGGTISGGEATFEGRCGDDKYFTSYTTFSSISTGDWVTLRDAGMWDTPTVVLVSVTTASTDVYVSGSNSTHVQLSFGGASASGSIFAGWHP